ncbi:hypothetical protein GCM10029964_045770 [Kibdelosporangium lantanae]
MSRTPVTLDWHEVPLAPDTQQATDALADDQHSVFPVPGPRLVRADGTELLHGSGPMRTALDGTTLVAVEVVTGHTKLSTLDLATGQPRSVTLDFAAEGSAIGGGFAVLQKDAHCLTVVNVHTLSGFLDTCDAQGGTFALLGAETDGVQWRLNKPDGGCGGWFHLGQDGTQQRLDVTEDECRAASLVQVGGWRVFAAFPRYETGSLYPGPLVARRGSREIALDNTVMDVHACGGHVYWLSKPTNENPGQGNLVRWMPGDNDIQEFDSYIPPRQMSTATVAASPRCVNGVLDFVTYTGGSRLWKLSNP